MEHRRSFIYGLFRHDIGRKLMALVVALVLFGILDQQVTTTQTFEIRIEYVNERDLLSEFGRERNALLIVQRGKGHETLVVATDERLENSTCVVRLEGRRTTIQQYQTQGLRLEYELSRPGRQMLEIEKVRGYSEYMQNLGPSGSIRLENEIELSVSTEETREIKLDPGDLYTRGIPARRGQGFQRTTDRVVFHPDRIHLTGPREILAQVADRQLRLFRDVDVEDAEARVEKPLQLDPVLARDVSLRESDVRVTIEFDQSMVRLEESAFKKAVQVVYNRDPLSPDPWLARGLKLSFVDVDENGDLWIDLFLQRPASLGADEIIGEQEETARNNVFLVVFADEAKVLHSDLKVHLLKREGFPSMLDVQFEKMDVTVEAKWVEPN